MSVIDRWQKLEEIQKPVMPAIPNNFAEALQLAADQAKQLEEQAPKIEVYEQLADRKGDITTTLMAKQIGIKSATKLNIILREQGIKWMKADLPKAGYGDWFNVVCGVKNDHEYSSCLVTPLGQIEITKLIKQLNTHKITGDK